MFSDKSFMKWFKITFTFICMLDCHASSMLFQFYWSYLTLNFFIHCILHSYYIISKTQHQQQRTGKERDGREQQLKLGVRLTDE